MQKIQVRNYSYSIVLGISFLIAGFVWVIGELNIKNERVISSTFTESTGGVSREIKQEIQDLADMFFMGRVTQAEEERTESVVTIPDNLGIGEMVMIDNEMAVAEEEETEEVAEDEIKEVADVPEFYVADSSYFNDALFIGDSRTVGLYEYGDLGEAEVFADTGMSVYQLFDEKFILRNGEEVSFKEAMERIEFGKIYIMLGINELGYEFEQTCNRFREVLEVIREYQPEAYIFIQANLHISEEKSKESEYFTNENIDRYNSAISQFADDNKIFYLDVNPLYDDETGSLSVEYTADHAHIKGKYYDRWIDFILQNAVRKK